MQVSEVGERRNVLGRGQVLKVMDEDVELVRRVQFDLSRWGSDSVQRIDRVSEGMGEDHLWVGECLTEWPIIQTQRYRGRPE